jgi:hypothetical protein
MVEVEFLNGIDVVSCWCGWDVDGKACWRHLKVDILKRDRRN